MAETGSLHATRFEAAVKVIQSLPKNGECGGRVRRQRRHRYRAGSGSGQGPAGGGARPRRAAGQRGRPGGPGEPLESSALVLLPACRERPGSGAF